MHDRSPPDPETVRLTHLATRSAKYLAKHGAELRAQHLNEWVFIHDGCFIAAHEDAAQARALVRAAGIDPGECIVEFMKDIRGRTFVY